MKAWFCTGILAAMALPALAGAAWAGGTEDLGCSNATLQGEYAFGVTNLTTPRVAAGIKVFDGNGKLTQRDYRGNSSPAEFAPPGQEKGTYQVSPDCTGSMVINLNELGVPPVTTQGGGHKHPVCDQRRRPSYPRSRFAADTAGIDRTRARPDQCRRLEGRVGAGPTAMNLQLGDGPR
jgi:hypothetical protein